MTVRLRVRHHDNEVQVVACNAEGERMCSSTLLAITMDGRLRRASNINRRLGFQLDSSSGQIRYSEGG